MSPVTFTCPKCARVFAFRDERIKGAFNQHVRACGADWRPRFWAKVEKTEDCWLWKGAKRWDGYGLVVINGKQYIMVVATGQSFDDREVCEYIGSVHLNRGALVFHVYELYTS